jgi:hypothetical protein
VGFEPWEVLAVWGIVMKHSTTGCISVVCSNAVRIVLSTLLRVDEDFMSRLYLLESCNDFAFASRITVRVVQ